MSSLPFSKHMRTCAIVCALWQFLPNPEKVGAQITTPAPPKQWLDNSTGHLITRLTDEPGSRALYFNLTGFSSDGACMFYTAQHNLYCLEWQSKRSRLLIIGPIRDVVASRTAPQLFFVRPADDALYEVDTNTGEQRKVGSLPARASLDSINADSSLVAGTYIEGQGADVNQIKLPPDVRPTPLARMVQRVEAKLPMTLYIYDLKTHQSISVLRSTDWLNHVQFSPKDATLLMYCHEGVWQDVDRIWTIRTNGADNKLIQPRTRRMEVAGHEFWSADGQNIWYDWQPIKGESFALAGYSVQSGRRTIYQLTRDEWSVHYNIAPDGKSFVGDGGDPFQVAEAKDGKWIWLFTPPVSDTSAIQIDGPKQIVAQRLVNMANHDYRVEPNVRYSPDGKSVIFSSNMLGATYVFAVETAQH